MTGGSLGQRASSYGSLQHLPSNSVVLPIYTTPVVARKSPKMLLSNAREKEKILPRIGKFAGRRRVGMLLLVVVSVVVLMSLLSVVSKACPVCYIPVMQAIARMPGIPLPSPVLRNLTYVHDENPVRTEPFGGSNFGGYPSLKQRNDSFDSLVSDSSLFFYISNLLEELNLVYNRGLILTMWILLRWSSARELLLQQPYLETMILSNSQETLAKLQRKMCVSICLWMKKQKHI
ncbi:hypothetical protein IFM89_019742 [Coptis chinensis]|uniref:Uncharacterized protein n=1 Tax=Coptis chinensis TaxID=261450 RepID=A0A835H3Z7_9MAGN|nr:hypothetical protein IFM89_019742 [Coptis chinensis]